MKKIEELILSFENFKENMLYKKYKITCDANDKINECIDYYDNNIKVYVDSIRKYFENLGNDFQNAKDFLGKYFDRVILYVAAFGITAVMFILMGLFYNVGLASIKTTLILIGIPASIIPLDISIILIAFVCNRIKRLYNNKLKKMVKDGGYRNVCDMVEKYRLAKEEEKEKERQEEISKEQKNICGNITELSDSDFLKNMFGFVSNSKYVSEEDRENFLNEINYILDKYAKLKKDNKGVEVNGYLKSDVDHLQNEYERYLNNTQLLEENNSSHYSLTLK